jgi:hypothetical protein
MTIRVSKTTAMVAGAWGALGIVPINHWIKHAIYLSAFASAILWFVTAVVFVFVPANLLVLGSQWYVLPFRVVMGRGLIWMLSYGVLGGLLNLLLFDRASLHW